MHEHEHEPALDCRGSGARPGLNDCSRGRVGFSGLGRHRRPTRTSGADPIAAGQRVGSPADRQQSKPAAMLGQWCRSAYQVSAHACVASVSPVATTRTARAGSRARAVGLANQRRSVSPMHSRRSPRAGQHGRPRAASKTEPREPDLEPSRAPPRSRAGRLAAERPSSPANTIAGERPGHTRAREGEPRQGIAVVRVSPRDPRPVNPIDEPGHEPAPECPKRSPADRAGRARAQPRPARPSPARARQRGRATPARARARTPRHASTRRQRTRASLGVRSYAPSVNERPAPDTSADPSSSPA